jgi:hypothetical protein
MARTIGDEGGSGGQTPRGRKPRQPKPHQPRGHRGHRGSGGQKPKHPHTPKPGTFHRQSGAGSAGHTAAGAAINGGHPAGAGLLARTLVTPPSAAGAAQGLGGYVLDLVAEGELSVNAALGAWQREQDRVTNRAWRRPGGLARIGKL